MKTLAQLNSYSLSSVNYSDQSSSSTQTLSNRYTINGVLDTSKHVLENIDKLCSSAGSWLGYDTQEGKWGVIINSTGTSVASFNDSNILGSISLTGTGIQDLYNEVKVQYPNYDLTGTIDYVNIDIPSLDRNPNEENNTLNLTYDIVNNPVQAQLLGFIELKQSRVDLVIKFQTDYSYIGLKAGDIIDVTDTRISQQASLFRIVTVSEIQDGFDPLSMEITALQYDPTVYSTSDLYKYTRSNANGIINIGSIGIPGTPSVTKYEVDTRPRIVATSLTPSGVVDGLEFWASSDISLSEANRSYQLISVQRPKAGGTFPQGTSVSIDYDNLSSSSFVMKTRGVNATVTGPWSAVSGSIIFTPTVVAGAVDANTSMNGIIGALSLLELLNAVNGLFNGSTGTNSIFKKVFDLFSTATGVDLVGLASSGTIVTPSTSIIVKDEGTVVSSSISTFNFIGTGVNVVNAGSEIVVQVNCCGGGGGSTGTTSTTSTSACSLKVGTKFPPDRTTHENPDTGATSDKAPITGPFYIYFDPVVGASTSTSPVYGPLAKGSGLISLYKSDGTLVQAMSPSSITIDKNLVTFPFADREYGTDYYVLMDEGIVRYCETCLSPEFSTPDKWNFNTPLYDPPTYSQTGTNFLTPPIITATTALYIIGIAASSCVDGPFSINFNNKIMKGSGNVYIKKISDLSTQAVIPVGEFSVSDSSLNLATLGGLVAGGITYFVEADPGIAVDATISDDCNIAAANNSSVQLSGAAFQFNIAGSLFATGYLVDSLPVTPSDYNKINPQSNIGITFNSPVTLSASGTVSLYEASGTLHQAFDIATSFGSNKTNEIIWTNANVLWINPTKDLKFGTEYYVTATGDCVKEACSHIWGGSSDIYAIRFKTDAGPSVSSPSVGPEEITISYDREISLNTYDPSPIEIVNSSGTVIKTIYPTDSSVSIT